MIKLGLLFLGDYFKFKNETYKIIGVSHHRNYNNVLCFNVITNKRKWLDMNDNVLEVLNYEY